MAAAISEFWNDMRTVASVIVILCSCFHCSLCADKNGIACWEVKKQFHIKGYDIKDVPYWPVSGDHLRICPQGMTCCSRETEELLSKQSQQDFDKALEDITGNIRHTFRSRTQKFDQFFTELLENAKRDLHNMFVRTYGLLYQRNSYVFADLFEDLNSYYKGRDLNLGDAFDKFFAVLMQKMFTLLNEQYKLDKSYLDCVTEYLDDVKPFGDVPQTLSSQVKRAFIAARTFVQGLAVGRDVLNAVVKVEMSTSCRTALMRMKHCPSCAGHTEFRTCNHYCLNVMKGCLAYHAELDKEWNSYIDALMQLAERLEGPFNIEAVVDPMSLKISDAIMNFQENSQKVSTKVFSGCGRPKLPGRKRRDAESGGTAPVGETDGGAPVPQADAGPPYGAGTTNTASQGGSTGGTTGGGGSSPQADDDNESFDEYPYNDFKFKGERNFVRPTTAAGTSLDRLVRDIKNKVKTAYGLWGNLSSSMCDKEPPQLSEDSCWNGNGMGRYMPEVMKEGILNQVNNPEVTIDLNKPNSLINQQILQLRLVVSKLKNAYNGMDVEWIDSADVSENMGSGSGDDLENSGSGSGDGMTNPVDDRGFQFKPFQPPDNSGTNRNAGSQGRNKETYKTQGCSRPSLSHMGVILAAMLALAAVRL